MIQIRKINGLWAVVDGKNIIECFDTHYEAENYFEPERLRQALLEFDQMRTWESLYDKEKKNERK